MARRGLRLMQEERRRVIDEREAARKNKQWWMSTRFRCLLLCDEGKTMEEAARICEVARSTVGEWIRKYRQGGLDAVKERGPYARKAPKLSPSQYQELREIIRGGPEAAGLDTGVWTAAVAAEALLKRFGVRWSLSQIRRTLRKRLVRHYKGRKIHLILDNAKYHKTKEIAQCWKPTPTRWRSIFFLHTRRNSTPLNWYGKKPRSKPLTTDTFPASLR